MGAQAHISAREALQLLKERPQDFAFVDLRSEKEFERGAIPGSRNLPILHNGHRHEVGLTYKTRGTEAAIALGHRLVDPLRPELVRRWAEAIGQSRAGQGVVFCWRGGLRSAIGARWMEEAGLPVRRVQGGFKALRRELLGVIESPPPVIVLAGFTGAGKTELLKEFAPAVDLEALAGHRGSAFGAYPAVSQPSQTSFENGLGLGLWGEAGPVLVEDESRFIGLCRLPDPFYAAKESADIVFLEESVSSRARRVYREYVAEAPQDASVLHGLYRDALEKLHKGLGGRRHQELAAALEAAFAQGKAAETRHLAWIEPLLEGYYDRRYQHALDRRPGRVGFRGNRDQCREWLRARGLTPVSASR